MTWAEIFRDPGLRKAQAWIFFLLSLNVALWAASSRVQAGWGGVPPVPSREGAAMMMLNDEQFSFRFGALTLQNLGDGGGEVTPIKDYDFNKLGSWFSLLHALDPASEHVPMIAAFYFGGSPKPDQVKVVVDYLAHVGMNPAGQKWRWLAHASYLARHKMNDLQLALDLAYKLARMKPLEGELPLWAKQLPAFILKEQGEKDGARELIEQLLLGEEHSDPAEVNFMKLWLTEQMGVPPAEVDAILKKRAELDEKKASESR